MGAAIRSFIVRTAFLSAVIWLSSAGALWAACSSPSGNAGDSVFNSDYRNLQYCDGSNWVGIGLNNSNTDVTSGLVARWKFDETSGTSAADSTGNGHTGTLNGGPTWQSSSGKLDGSLQFDGVNDYVDAGKITEISGASAATITGWMYRSSTSETAEFGQYLASNRFLIVWSNDGLVYNQAENGADSYPFYANSSTGWHHFALVFDGSQSSWSRVTAYFDGQAQTLTPGGTAPSSTLASGASQPAFRFGLDYLISNRFYGGSLDDVRVYSRALSASEILQLYQYCTTCACDNPSGAQGSIVYNAAYRTPQFCNGTAWQNFGRTYTAWGVTFDGTNDYLTRGADLTTSADSGLATGSFWIRRAGGNGTLQVIYCAIDSAGSCRYQIDLNTSNQIHVKGNSSGGGTLRLDVTSGTTITDTNWHHVMYSFDLTSADKRHLYIDGADASPTWGTYSTGNAIEFTRSEHSIGAFTNGNSKLNGDLADFYLDIGAYKDLARAPQRELFYSASGNAVNMGTDGSRPSGSAPEVFLSDVTLSTWPTNKGTGGGFTVTGALETAQSSPGRACSNTFICKIAAQAGSYDTAGSAQGVWSDGTYIYVADGTSGILALTFDGSTFSLAGSYDTAGSAVRVWGDGTYVFVADSGSGVLAFTFNGSTFTPTGSYDTSGTANSVWGDGSYIYVADGSGGLLAFTYNGSSFTLAGSYAAGTVQGVWGDGTYIYAGAHSAGIQAYTFNGSTFTPAGSYDTTGSASHMWGDGTYIYLVDGGTGSAAILLALTFNGSTFSQVGSYSVSGLVSARDVWGDGSYIYATYSANPGVRALTFNGSAFSLVTTYSSGSSYGVWGNGDYAYIGVGSSGVLAMSPNFCKCSSPTAREGSILYDSDNSRLRYCDGVSWKGVGK